MPNAILAVDHSTWNSDDVTSVFWNATAPGKSRHGCGRPASVTTTDF
jgi:hypothetical protein